MEESMVRKLVERARFLAAGQDDPHSVTITELCDAIESVWAAALDSGIGEVETISYGGGEQGSWHEGFEIAKSRALNDLKWVKERPGSDQAS